MKKFMGKDFLLSNDVAKELYDNYGKEMPIYDYHCHLSPKEIWEDRRYENITEVWLNGDHYKWRAMRSNGVDEEYITGNASDFDKFKVWAKTLPRAIGNPLYHWTHLELQRYFGIHSVLNEENAEMIWNECNEQIKGGDFSARSLINRSNVKLIGTTDDPIDSLEYHKLLKEDDTFDVKVVPSFRPDKVINIDADGFVGYIEKLEGLTHAIKSIDDVKKAISSRMDLFEQMDCKISDHAFQRIPFVKAQKDEINSIFSRALCGEKLNDEEVDKYKTYIMLFLSDEYKKRDWVMQLHIGALRNNNQYMFNKIGPDTGFDSIADHSIAEELSGLLDMMLTQNGLPKTILYTLNPKDNYVLGAMLGNFQGSEVAGKIQFGSGWWFCDQKQGMIQQMTDLASLGLLGNFVGMLTDSRSFLSYTRHEYFRRILCSMIGEWVINGELPYDVEYLGSIVSDISYNNAHKYFNINI